MPVTGGRSWTSLPPDRKVRWTVGWASAIRENISRTCPASVESDFRNERRTGVLKKRLRTSITVPGGHPRRQDRAEDAPLDRDLRALRGVGLPRLAAGPRDLGDRRQRLAAEAQGADPEQVVGHGQLARRVRPEGQRQVVGRHPRAVVGDPDQVLAPALDRHVDPRRPGVDRRSQAVP